MPLIQGISFEFNGCLLTQSSKSNIIRDNKELLDGIRKASTRYQSTTLFIGSYCQSIRDDRAHSRDYGSIYPFFLQLAEHLGAKADRFLLASLYNNLSDEEIFDTALRRLNENHPGYDDSKLKGTPVFDWLYDDSKLSILYAQIHKFASEHPEDTLHFSFYDHNVTVLEGLQTFFHSYPYLLPGSLTLQLVHYQGAVDETGKKIIPLITAYEPLTGTGTINREYHLAIKEMAGDCIVSSPYQHQGLISSGTTGKPVRNFLDAQAEGFYITTSLNCARDYRPFRVREPYYRETHADTTRYRGSSHPAGSSQSHPLTSPDGRFQTLSCSSFFSTKTPVILGMHRTRLPMSPSSVSSSSSTETDEYFSLDPCCSGQI
ncbi:hypothetical protein [Legionella sp. CNM-4043-24]|uniref:hypothetical protein n=1 Tax=Legionella sp. CNM-4043-24 TaxID=3421646 RepID=UPI00403AA74B